MSFRDQGFEHCRGLLPLDRITALRRKMITIMAPYCSPTTASETLEATLDRCFSEVSARSQTTKSNIYKMFGRLADLPLLLDDPAIRAKIGALGFEASTIQAYSVFCLEPGNTRHRFLPHQDLRNRTSLKSLLIWVPLSAGPDIGGMACWPGSNEKGPLRHNLNASGQLELPTECYADYQRLELADYDIGDVIFMDPYLIHESIVNRGSRIRWTAVVKIDDIATIDHLDRDLHPFPVEEYIDSRSNEARITERAATSSAGCHRR